MTSTFKQQQDALRSVQKNVMPPQSLAHWEAINADVPCPDEWCGCKFTVRVVRTLDCPKLDETTDRKV